MCNWPLFNILLGSPLLTEGIQWHIGADRDAYFRTPRGLRYLVQSGPAEDRAHPDYDPDDMITGEIGHLLEWLIFGYVTDIEHSPTGPFSNPLHITGWGSWTGNNLCLDNQVCRTLLQARPHLRMPAQEMRVFVENLKRAEASGGTDPMDIDDDDDDDDFEDVIMVGDPMDIDSGLSGVSIPNTVRGKAFRHAFIRLDVETERARARGRARRRANRVNACGPGTGGRSWNPDVRLHNNLNWRTDEMPPPSAGLLSFLPNSDRRVIMVGYIFLCIASDYGLRLVWPTFTSTYSSTLTAIIMVLGFFFVGIPDSLTARSDSTS